MPLRILPKKDPTASFHAASPASSANVVQNSSRNSLGNLSTSSFFLFSPNEDLRRPITGGTGEEGTAVGSNSDLGDPPPKDRVKREPEGDVPCIPGDASGEGANVEIVDVRGCDRC